MKKSYHDQIQKQEESSEKIWEDSPTSMEERKTYNNERMLRLCGLYPNATPIDDSHYIACRPVDDTGKCICQTFKVDKNGDPELVNELLF